MIDRTDIAVIGLGIAGSAIAAQLSRRYKIVGIDRFTPPHALGSSHGENRIIRGAPGEGEVYAQLVARSFALFTDLERQTGRSLVHDTGGFDASLLPSTWAMTVRTLCGQMGLPCEMMDGYDFARRFGNFALPPSADVVLQPRFGHIDAEQTWQTFLDIAAGNRADLRFGTAVERIEYGSPSTIVFADGSKLISDRLILAAGGWLATLFDLPLKLRVERRVLAWHRVERSYGRILPFCYDDGKTGRFWYGMPTLDGRGLKFGAHKHLGEIVAPDDVPPVNDADLKLLGSFIAARTRGIAPTPYRTATCKYTLTANEDFILGRHPNHEDVFVFSCCSGHGFKYAPVYGEIAEALIDGQDYPIDLSRFAVAAHLAEPPPL